MKNYDVEIKRNNNDCWDCEAVPDTIAAENENEAVEIARDYLKDQCDTAAERDTIDTLMMRAIERNDSEMKRTHDQVIAAILAYYAEHEEEFNATIEELDAWNGYLGDDRYHEIEMLSEFYHNSDPIELLQRAYFGYSEDYTDKDGRYTDPFNPNADYFRYNGYGNLVSSNYKDYSAFLDEYFVESVIENINHLYDVPDEVRELIESEVDDE